MFATICIPDFFLQAQLRNPSDTRPAAVIETSSGKDNKARILELSETARQLGVLPGMTAAQGQARSAELVTMTRSPEAEAETQKILLKTAHDYTPDFEETRPGAVTLDLLSAKCPDAWKLGWDIVEELAANDSLRAQIGIAPTPDLADMLSRHAAPVYAYAKDGDDDFLRQLPVSSLEFPPDMEMVLTLWGINTAGDFLSLPKNEIGERLGPDAIDWWETISGKKTRLLRLIRPPRDFSQSAELEYELETLEPLLFILRRHLDVICARLNAAWLAVGEIRLRLDFTNGSHYQRNFRVPDPTTEVDLLFRLLHIHLEDFTAQAPITGLQIEAFPARKLHSQFHLFESGLRDPNRFAETLARLEALLGSGRVGRPQIKNSHHPDAFEVLPFEEESEKTAKPNPASETAASIQLGLPLRRFRPPLFAEVVTGENQTPSHITSPATKGKISDCRGPWRSSGDWWNSESRWSRSEWDIEMANGGLYRLANEAPGEWRIEGVYG